MDAQKHDATTGDDDDLMAMLEESQQDFDKKLNLNDNQKEEEKENVISQLENANKMDQSKTENDPKVANEDQPNPEMPGGADFMKGFEEFAKNMSGMGGDAVSPEELANASNLFKGMFGGDMPP